MLIDWYDHKNTIKTICLKKHDALHDILYISYIYIHMYIKFLE